MSSFYRDPSSSRWQSPLRISAEIGWYDLFSRGARDWLRHNEKVRESVEKSAQLIAEAWVMGVGGRTVSFPVRPFSRAASVRDPESEPARGGPANRGQVVRRVSAAGS